MPQQRQSSLSKWVRIVAACVLMVSGGAGVFAAVRTGWAQERYFRVKYGHMLGTRYQVLPTNDLKTVLELCEQAHDAYPDNYYFCTYASLTALEYALSESDELVFRRHFGTAEHWCKISRGINPYDIEACYIWCRILWEKGDRKGAVAFWRDEVVAREFWNPELRLHLVDLCRRSGEYSEARRQAAFLPGFLRRQELKKLPK